MVAGWQHCVVSTARCTAIPICGVWHSSASCAWQLRCKGWMPLSLLHWMLLLMRPLHQSGSTHALSILMYIFHLMCISFIPCEVAQCGELGRALCPRSAFLILMYILRSVYMMSGRMLCSVQTAQCSYPQAFFDPTSASHVLCA